MMLRSRAITTTIVRSIRPKHMISCREAPRGLVAMSISRFWDCGVLDASKLRLHIMVQPLGRDGVSILKDFKDTPGAAPAHVPIFLLRNPEFTPPEWGKPGRGVITSTSRIIFPGTTFQSNHGSRGEHYMCLLLSPDNQVSRDWYRLGDDPRSGDLLALLRTI